MFFPEGRAPSPPFSFCRKKRTGRWSGPREKTPGAWKPILLHEAQMGPWTPSLLGESASRRLSGGVGGAFCASGGAASIVTPDDFSLVPPGGTVSFCKKETVGPTVLPPGGRNLSSCGPWPQTPVPARGRYPRALRESPVRPVAATPRPRPRRKSPVPARERNRLFQASGTAGDNPSGGFAASSLYTGEPYLVRLRRRAEIPPCAECSSAWSAF